MHTRQKKLTKVIGGKCEDWTLICWAKCPNLDPRLSSAFSSSLRLRHAAFGLRFLSVIEYELF